MLATWNDQRVSKGNTMARPPKDKAPDLNTAQDLTAGLIERLTCPGDKAQAFMRDTKTPGLRVRVTTAGAKSFVFEAIGETVKIQHVFCIPSNPFFASKKDV